MKIRTKIFLSFFVTSLVLITITVVIFYFYSRVVIEKSINDQMTITADLVANNITSVLDGYKQTTELLASNSLFSSILVLDKESEEYKPLLAKLNGEINQIIKDFSEVYKVKVIDRNGIIVAGTAESDIGVDKSAELTFLEGQKKTYIRDLHFSKIAQGPGLDIATPIFLNESGEIAGVVVLDFYPNEIYAILSKQIGPWKTRETYLINKDGLMISPLSFVADTFLSLKVKTRNSEDCLSHLEEQEKETDILKGYHANTSTFENYSGILVIGTHAHIPQMQWCVMVEVVETEATLLFDKLLLVSIMLGSIFLLMFSVISSIIGRTISRPLSKLQKGMEIIGKGDLNYKVGTRSKDEIGMLSRTFDKMTTAIKKSRADVDKKVEEQTREIFEKQRFVEKTLIEMKENKANLEEMNDMMVGREIKMIELKEENERLKKKVSKNKS